MITLYIYTHNNSMYKQRLVWVIHNVRFSWHDVDCIVNVAHTIYTHIYHIHTYIYLYKIDSWENRKHYQALGMFLYHADYL